MGLRLGTGRGVVQNRDIPILGAWIGTLLQLCFFGSSSQNVDGGLAGDTLTFTPPHTHATTAILPRSGVALVAEAFATIANLSNLDALVAFPAHMHPPLVVATLPPPVLGRPLSLVIYV